MTRYWKVCEQIKKILVIKKNGITFAEEKYIYWLYNIKNHYNNVKFVGKIK